MNMRGFPHHINTRADLEVLASMPEFSVQYEAALANVKCNVCGYYANDPNVATGGCSSDICRDILTGPVNLDGPPYLLMVEDTLGLRIGNTNEENQTNLNNFASSPYDGLTYLCWLNNYGFSSSSTSQDWIDDLVTTKDLWPWTVLDELITASGIDVDDRDGGMTNWLTQWETALIKARDSGCPGIIVDSEPYSDYTMHDMATAAIKYGVTQEYLQGRLVAIGEQMIDIVNATYPGATIWNLWAIIDSSRPWPVCYIHEGMLAGLVATESTSLFVSQWGIHYYATSLAAWEAEWNTNIYKAQVFLAANPNYRLGAPITIWNDVETVTGWIKTWADANPTQPFCTLTDFHPVMDELKQKFDYIWVYNDANIGYNPFDAISAAPYSAAIQRIKARPCKCA
jgi:hypothetical protein